ncbi:MAG: hypothetical protein ACRDTC_26535, partial [Pseudonocardiaceae bacterium]
LGHSAGAAAAVRVSGRLPWPALRRLYARIGAAEGIDPHRLADVDLAAVAERLADGYPQRRYPAVLVGSSNGALTHLAAALQVPWLPGTVLVPVAHAGDPQRPVDALRFGERFAPHLLEANPDVVLHQMHDQIQDELMVARMAYFRTKWCELPAAYARFLTASLLPGAPVMLIEDASCWPVVRIGARHVFQPGAQGGCPPQSYLQRSHTPRPDDEAPEAEWGADPGLGAALAAWCATHRHPLVRLTYRGPQTPAHAVATVMRTWYARRGERADRLLVPSFVVGDPWRTINTAAVPFWTFFAVQPALRAFEDHLQASTPYRRVELLLFQHGVRSEGIADPAQWLAAARRHGATAGLLAVDRRRFPHAIASLGRYGRAPAHLRPARHPWSPLSVNEAIQGLRTAGFHIHPA